MRITRSQLGQIIREEAAHITEAGRLLKGPARAVQRANARRRRGQVSGLNANSFEAIDAVTQFENFADALDGFREMLNGSRSGHIARLRDRIAQTEKMLRQLAKSWQNNILGNVDEDDIDR